MALDDGQQLPHPRSLAQSNGLRRHPPMCSRPKCLARAPRRLSRLIGHGKASLERASVRHLQPEVDRASLNSPEQRYSQNWIQ